MSTMTNRMSNIILGASAATVMALAAMGETLGTRALVGAALALVGIALMSR